MSRRLPVSAPPWAAYGVELEGPATGFTATVGVRAAEGWNVVEGTEATLGRGPLWPGSPSDFFLRVTAPPGIARVRASRARVPASATGNAASLLGLALLALAFRRTAPPQKTEPPA